MLPLTPFFAGLGAGAGLIVAIGAQNMFVLRQGLRQRHVGVVVVICSLADIVLIVAGVAGLGLLVRGHADLLQALRYLGAVFLFGYGLLALRRCVRGEMATPMDGSDEDRGAVRMALACLGFTLLNPHVYLDTVGLLGSISTQFPGMGRWWFAAGASCSSVLWFSALGFGARLLLPVFRSAKAWRRLDGVIAVVMLTLAMALLRS